MVGGLTPGPNVAPDPAEASRRVAERLVAFGEEARSRSGRFALAVSGGRTPERLFELLAERYFGRIPWARTTIYFADERFVPPDDPRSNFALLRRTLLASRAVRGPEVRRIVTEAGSPGAAAARYEAELRAEFGGERGGPPQQHTFDAILLGVGPDGHTASLFPGAESLRASERWAVLDARPPLAPKVPRITLTLPVIGASRHALFLVCGAEKREILRRLFADPARGTPRGELPSARVTAAESVEWFVDAAAAPP